jgi:prevent-host-death family protein
MDEMSADEARRKWRDMLDRVHVSGQVGITRNGKPWAVLVSRDWYDRAEALMAKYGETEG